MNDCFYKAVVENSQRGFAYHRALFDGSGQVCDFEYISANQAFKTMAGFAGDSIFGKKIMDVLPTLQTAGFDWLKFFGEVAVGGASKECEHYSEALQRWYRMFVSSPQQNCFVADYVDITEQKKQLDMLGGVFDIYLGLVYETEAEKNLVKVNYAWEKALGYAADELQGKDLLEFVHPEDLVVTVDFITSLGSQNTTRSFVNRYRSKDGPYRYFEWQVQSKNNLTFASAQDITERKLSEEKQSLYISLIDATLESTAEGIVVISNEGKIMRHNNKFSVMWNIPEALLASGADAAIMNFAVSKLAVPEQFWEDFRELSASSESSSMDTLKLSDRRVFECYSQPEKINGVVVGRVWSFRDITAQQLVERQILKTNALLRQALAKKDFVSALAEIAYVDKNCLGANVSDYTFKPVNGAVQFVEMLVETYNILAKFSRKTSKAAQGEAALGEGAATGTKL